MNGIWLACELQLSPLRFSVPLEGILKVQLFPDVWCSIVPVHAAANVELRKMVFSVFITRSSDICTGIFDEPIHAICPRRLRVPLRALNRFTPRPCSHYIQSYGGEWHVLSFARFDA